MSGKHIPRILVVDSEPKWSQAVKDTLEKGGKYYVENVGDIETALTSSYADGFDLIFINATLAFGEDISKFREEDISKFREIVYLYADKVLVISDVHSISTAIKVFKMGADYAEKPFEPRRVIELVASRL